jgi:hypothetical protein
MCFREQLCNLHFMLSTYNKKSLHVAKIITDLLPYYAPRREAET